MATAAPQTVTMTFDARCKPTNLGSSTVTDATFRKPGTAKSKQNNISTIFSLCALAFAIFCLDQLLLGRTDEAQSNLFVREVWGMLNSLSTNISGLDCCCTVVPFLFIALQLARRKGFLLGGNDTSTSTLSSKNPKHGGSGRGRDDAGTGSASTTRPAVPRPDANVDKRVNATPLSRWNQAIDMAAREGDGKKAGRLLMQFEQQGDGKAGNWPDTVSYNIVIRACAKKGDFQSAEHWLRRMIASGLEATVCSYNTVLDACAKAGHPEVCEAWLEQMLSKGIEANVISYATVIYARARRGEEALAEAWLRRMTDAEIEPDAVCYNSLIHASGVSGNPAGAERWIEEMRLRGLEATVTTYTAVIDACAKGGDTPRAEKWLEKMIAAEVQPNVVTFSAMIDACAKASNPTRAEYWHTKMVECGVTPNAHSSSAIINACAKAGDVNKAEEWLARFEEGGIATDVVVYSSVIDACGKVGDAEKATATFHRMQANGIQPHIVAYAALARPYAYRGDWVEVERIASEMASRGIYPNEYFLYAQLLSYATFRPRQAARAEDCFRQAMQMGLKANDHVVSVLVRACGRERCTELMNELCNGRSIPVPPSRRDGPAGNRVKALPRRTY